MPVMDAIVRSRVLVFDVIRKQFKPAGTMCFLLKRTQNSGNFEVIRQIESGYLNQWDKYREQTTFEFATADESFADDFAQVTHIAYGVPDADLQIFVYGVDPDQKEGTPSDGLSPVWKAFCSRMVNERFDLP